MRKKYSILIMTPVGRTKEGNQIDYFPTRWSGSSGKYKVNAFYPYQLAYLSSNLKMKTEHNIRMIDANYYGTDTEEYISIVETINPDILIIEVDSIIYKKQLEIIRRLRNDGLEAKVIFCGPHSTAYPEYTLKKGVDYVALGEFEESIPNLINNNFDSNIKGIYPNGRAELVCLDNLPLPEDKDIKRRNYNRLYGSEYREVEVFGTRGCPYMCNFCVASNIYYGKPSYRTRQIESVISEIKYLANTINELEGVFFNEEVHTLDKKFILQLCDRIIEEKLDCLKFNCMTNYASLDYELLYKMKKAGYYKIRIGIETLDEENTRQITKSEIKSKNNKLIDVLEICKVLDIKVYCTLSTGTIGSTYQKDINSLNQIKLLYEEELIQEFSISMNTPMPGTPFFKTCQENNWLIEEEDSYDGAFKTMIDLPNYSMKDIEKAFEYGNKIKNYILESNKKKGIKYSMYDKDWCQSVYETSNRKTGEGVI
jgi:radical SAM superfamily enzyme YgiQ (UPF0313 family)